jgi:hypothetical protein
MVPCGQPRCGLRMGYLLTPIEVERTALINRMFLRGYWEGAREPGGVYVCRAGVQGCHRPHAAQTTATIIEHCVHEGIV